MKTPYNPSGNHTQTAKIKPVTSNRSSLSRRQFLWRTGGTAAGVLGLGLPPFGGLASELIGAPGGLQTLGMPKGLNSVLRWSRIANDASGYDHATAREQLGPGRASRAIAIAHIAMFDAVATVTARSEEHTTELQ